MTTLHNVTLLRACKSWSRFLPPLVYVSVELRGGSITPPRHQFRSSHYQASESFPTRVRDDYQHTINEFIALEAFTRKMTGYTFQDQHLLLQALYGSTGGELPRHRLALLGDMLLSYILTDDWFQAGIPTTHLGVVKSRVVSNANLALRAKELGLLERLAVLDVMPERLHGVSDHDVGTIMEALLGAIHEDSGKDCEAVRRAMYMMGLKLPESYLSTRDLPPTPSRRRRTKTETRAKRRFKRLLNRGGFRSVTIDQTQNEDHDHIQDADDDDLDVGDRAMEDSIDDVSISASATDQELYDKPNSDLTNLVHPELEEEPYEGANANWRNLEDQDSSREDFEALITELENSQESLPMTSEDVCSDDEINEHVTHHPHWTGYEWTPQHCQITLEVAKSGRPIRRRT